MTLCTIAIPVYNRAELVGRAVESALTQDISDFEVLAIDNCSTDDTWDRLGSFHHPKFRRLRNTENLGLFGNMSRCVELAQGKYLRILCSDDRLPVNCLREEIALMERHPNVSLLSTRGVTVSEAGARVGLFANHFSSGIYDGRRAQLAWFSFFANYGYNPLNYPSGLLFRKSALIKAMPFDKSLGAIADIDVMLRTLEHGDLAITERLGSYVMRHGKQEGSTVYVSGQHIDEARDLVEKYRTVLMEGQIYHQIKRRMTALPLGWVIKRWRETSGQSLEKFTAHGDTWEVILPMIARLILLRLLLKTTGFRLTPHLRPVAAQPEQPTRSCSIRCH